MVNPIQTISITAKKQHIVAIQSRQNLEFCQQPHDSHQIATMRLRAQIEVESCRPETCARSRCRFDPLGDLAQSGLPVLGTED